MSDEFATLLIDDETDHTPWGPSSANGWTTCPDYVNANRGLPDNTMEVAAEGTAAHQISDLCLKSGKSAYDYIGHVTKVDQFSFTWSLEDAELLQPGLEHIRSFDGDFYGEQRVDVSPWTKPGQKGTLDRAIVCRIEDELWIVISDLKWGRGVAVSPFRNKQMALYALAFWDLVRDKLQGEVPKFRLEIDQPRCPGGGGVWATTLDELEEIAEWMRLSVKYSYREEGTIRIASEIGCMWCKRKTAPGGCNVYEAWRFATLGVDFDNLSRETIELPAIQTPERRANLLLHKRGIERWLETHESDCMRDAQDGKPIGHLKCVVDTRKGSRDKWESEDFATLLIEPSLGENSFTKKLKTPKQIDMQLPKESRGLFQHLVIEGRHGFSLVPLEDNRPSISTGSEFDDL